MGTLSCGMRVGSSSQTRDQTRAPCIGNAESYPLDYQGSPKDIVIWCWSPCLLAMPGFCWREPGWSLDVYSNMGGVWGLIIITVIFIGISFPTMTGSEPNENKVEEWEKLRWKHSFISDKAGLENVAGTYIQTGFLFFLPRFKLTHTVFSKAAGLLQGKHPHLSCQDWLLTPWSAGGLENSSYFSSTIPSQRSQQKFLFNGAR